MLSLFPNLKHVWIHYLVGVLFVGVLILVFLMGQGNRRVPMNAIRIQDNGFLPEVLRVKQGTKVRFINETQEWRWPASDPHPTHTFYSEFDPQKPIGPGEEWRFSFNNPGEWGFHDHLAPYLTGTIIVGDSQSSLRTKTQSNLRSIALAKEPTPQKFSSLDFPTQLTMMDAISKTKSVGELRQFLLEAYPDESKANHDLAHKLGELAIKKNGLRGFAFCDTSFDFGCFHGASLAAIRLYGPSEDLSQKLWEGCRREAVFPGDCLHGLGHAIMVMKRYNLLEAYQECERVVKDEDDSFWCQDGVSMENRTRSLGDRDLKPYGKSDDPYYPCNTLPLRYEAPCVRNHVEYIKDAFNFGQKDLLAFCASFGAKKTRTECIAMLGTLAAKEFSDSANVVERCKAANEDQFYCMRGAVISRLMSKHFASARELCGSLITIKEKTSCDDLIASFKR